MFSTYFHRLKCWCDSAFYAGAWIFVYFFIVFIDDITEYFYSKINSLSFNINEVASNKDVISVLIPPVLFVLVDASVCRLREKISKFELIYNYLFPLMLIIFIFVVAGFIEKDKIINIYKIKMFLFFSVIFVMFLHKHRHYSDVQELHSQHTPNGIGRR